MKMTKRKGNGFYKKLDLVEVTIREGYRSVPVFDYFVILGKYQSYYDLKTYERVSSLMDRNILR